MALLRVQAALEEAPPRGVDLRNGSATTSCPTGAARDRVIELALTLAGATDSCDRRNQPREFFRRLLDHGLAGPTEL